HGRVMRLDLSNVDVRRVARYATVGAIVIVVGGLWLVRDVLPSDEAGAQALGVVAGAPRPELGQVAPDFVLEAPGTGEHVRLSDFRGQTVVLNFWATWCVPCRSEMPDLQRAYEDEDIVVLAVDAQESD